MFVLGSTRCCLRVLVRDLAVAPRLPAMAPRKLLEAAMLFTDMFALAVQRERSVKSREER